MPRSQFVVLDDSDTDPGAPPGGGEPWGSRPLDEDSERSTSESSDDEMKSFIVPSYPSLSSEESAKENVTPVKKKVALCGRWVVNVTNP